MLNSLGFNITVKSMEYSEYKQALLKGNFDLYYGEVRLSPNFDLSPFFGATGTLNYGDLADSTMMNLCSMALVNSGNTYNLSDAGDLAAAYLHSCGRDRIDLLVLTHLHEDHADGVPRLMEMYDIETLIMPEERGDALYEEIVALSLIHI